MRSTDDENTPEKLPVTAEVGDEGGSFADATQQAETFAGVTGNPRVEPKTVGAEARDPAGASGIRRDTGGPPDDVTHATDRPDTKR